jgi:hypothetical protein
MELRSLQYRLLEMVKANGFWGNLFDTNRFGGSRRQWAHKLGSAVLRARCLAPVDSGPKGMPIEMRVGKKLKTYTTEIYAGRILKT